MNWKLIGLIVAFWFFLAICMGIMFTEPIILAFGWIPFLYNTVPKMYVEWEAVAVSAVALVGFVVILHALASWLYGTRTVEGATSVWRKRWTALTTGLVFCIFAAGISALVIVHETGWLLMSNKPIYTMGGESARRANSMNNLRQIGLAARGYHDKFSEFPAGGCVNQQGEGTISWMTALLPWLEVNPSKPPAPDKSWRDPANAEFYQRTVPGFINPSEVSPAVDEQGYGLSHYTGNVRVLRPNKPIKMSEITDGTSLTILTGDVAAGFCPWGDPTNLRDPAKGIGVSKDQFGSNRPGQLTVVVMVDCSSRTISSDIDPAVLEALATPDGGEKLPEDWDQ